MKIKVMNKSVCAFLLTTASLLSVMPVFVFNNQTGDNKVIKTSKAIGIY
jgi:hypothetical protein